MWNITKPIYTSETHKLKKIKLYTPHISIGYSLHISIILYKLIALNINY